MRRVFLFAFAIAPGVLAQSASEIMARVAENQDRSEKLRSAYIYHQTVSKIAKFTDGQIDSQQVREYDVLPTPTRVDFDSGSMDDKDSRDGIGSRLFPLTGKEQARYKFELAGQQKHLGRDVYKVRFTPVDIDQTCWAGDDPIDAREYQPVLVQTRLAQGIPFTVRTFLGTNVKDLGFTLAYQKFDDGVWFPVSFEGDFTVRILFFLKRNMEMSLRNSYFKKTDVQTNVSFEREALQ